MRISDWSSDVCSSDLGESISLTLFDDGFVVFVARSEVTRVVSTGFRIGIRAPAWNTAAGRVLLGALTDDEVRAYLDGEIGRASCREECVSTFSSRLSPFP